MIDYPGGLQRKKAGNKVKHAQKDVKTKTKAKKKRGGIRNWNYFFFKYELRSIQT